MLKGPKLKRFRKQLLTWFEQSRRDLPWRRTRDPYRIWLSEIMLQQTRVAAAIPYYERFLNHFPDVKSLAEAPEEDVLRLWAGLGYYSRARNLQKAARQIVAGHGSHFPQKHEEALALAGIGEYTAAAVLSIAYGKRLAVLDGNVARVLARLTALRGDLRAKGRWQRLQALADKLLAPQVPGKWNEAMMELGATVCTPRSPQCLLCPVADFCQARKLGLALNIPEKRNKRATVEVQLAALVLVDAENNTLLLSPSHHAPQSKKDRDIAALLSRMWHFPTITVTRNAESDLRTYVRAKVFRGLPFRTKLLALAPVHHTVTHREITLLPFLAQMPELPNVGGARHLPLRDLSSVPISGLTRKISEMALPARAQPPSRLTSRAATLPFQT